MISTRIMLAPSCIFLLVQLVLCLDLQGAERITRRQSDDFSAQHISNLILSQRPTQFISPSQAHGLSVHTRGPLILPANNPVQVGHFHSSNHPSKYLQVTNNADEFSPSTVKATHSPSSNNTRNLESVFLPRSVNLSAGHSNRNEDAIFRTLLGDSNFNWPSSHGLHSVASSDNGEQQETRQNLTTDYNNNISTGELQSASTQSDKQQELPKSKEYQSTSANQSAELSNQVFYEGPPTVPPIGYYFSSSEKLPHNEKSANAWWSLGFGSEFDKANNLTRDDYLDYCTRSTLLASNKQRMLCKSHPKIMSIVARGLKMAIDECQLRFSSSRWNCSLIIQNSSDEAKPQIFGDVMKHPNREKSFLNAIVAAGLAHAMTKACSQGELPEECSCDKKIKSKNKGKIEWVACSDDIDFGSRFSRDFTDYNDNDSDTTSMINSHNYEVGRRVFKSTTDITCTCQNGDNNLCMTKRCWRHLGSFNDIGDELIRRYEGATHVQQSNKDPYKLRPVRRGVRRPKRKDLVYIEESPDYCTPDTRLGVLGTQYRHCNSTSSGPDSCSLLCCGRGYQMVVEEVEEDCNCKFVWCCQVKCDKCKRYVTNDVCN